MTNAKIFDEEFRRSFYWGGVWSAKQTRSYKIYANAVYVVFVYMYLSFILKTSQVGFDRIPDFGYNVGGTLSMTVTLMKLLVARTKKYQSFMDEIFEREDYLYSGTPKRIQEIYEKITLPTARVMSYLRYSITFTIIMITLVLIVLSINYLRTDCDLEECNLVLLMPAYVPLETRKFYIVHNFYYFSIALVVGYLTLVADFVILCPMVYITFRIGVLNYVLRNPEEFFAENEESDKLTYAEKYYKVAVQCVLEHQDIIAESEELSSISSIPLFFDFLLHSTQIACFTLPLLTTDDLFEAQTIMNFSSGTFVFFELFVLYWHGQIMLDESVQIPISIGESDWHLSDVKTRKMLMMMMIRSTKAIGVRNGPLGYVEIRIFYQILKAIFSIIKYFLFIEERNSLAQQAAV